MSTKATSHLYGDVSYPVVNIKRVENELIQSLMINMYKANHTVHAYDSEGNVMRDSNNKPIVRNLRNEIEDAYYEHFGKRFKKSLINADTIPQLLLGMPGNAKTSIMESAAKKVSELLNLKFVKNLDENTILRDDMMIVEKLELAGVDSNTEIKGLPKVTVNEDGSQTMNRVPPAYASAPFHVAGYLLIMDDFVSASPQGISALHGLLQRETDDGKIADNIVIGLTGNLGTLDNTASTALSAPIASRGKVGIVHMSVSDVVNHLEEKYGMLKNQNIVLLSSFLESNAKFFNAQPKRNTLASVTNARTVEILIEKLAKVDAKYHDNTNLSKYKEAVTKYASMHLGPEAGSAFGVHAYMYRSHAIPMAKELMEKGNLTPEMSAILEKEYGDGINTSNVNFGTQLSIALSNEASRLIIDKVADKKPTKEDEDYCYDVFRRMIDGVMLLNSARMIGTNLRRFLHVTPNELSNNHKMVITKIMNDNSKSNKFNSDVEVNFFREFAEKSKNFDGLNSSVKSGVNDMLKRILTGQELTSEDAKKLKSIRDKVKKEAEKDQIMSP